MHYKENHLTCASLLHSYLIIIKGLMPNVVESLYHVLTSPDVNPPAWMLHGGNWISIFMLLLVPLCFLRTLHSLRHTSYVALFAVGESALIPLIHPIPNSFQAYLLTIVIKCYFWPIKNMPAPGKIRLIHFTPSFVSTFPVQVFAYTCAQNVSGLHAFFRTKLI
jgi:amino acid permease